MFVEKQFTAVRRGREAEFKRCQWL
uniref:Uncharacterized protein n=1 Tax=Anguilla anguilla TaxID=7936 RepID=A0A0E9SMF3_ANGAN